MGTTEKFLKLRSTASTIKLGEWHNNFTAIKKFAVSNKVPLIAVWSNGDKCGHCINFETSAMHSTFKKWMQESKCAFWFGYYGDKSKEDTFEGTGFKWCYNNGKVTSYPFVRIYWKGPQGVVDVTQKGDDLTDGIQNAAKGAANLVSNLKKILKTYKPEEVTPEPPPEPEVSTKTRLNEALTVKQVNAVLDAIDANDGYCPCQPKSATTKCHCEDFLKNKKIGEPCICNLYVKQPK